MSADCRLQNDELTQTRQMLRAMFWACVFGALIWALIACVVISLLTPETVSAILNPEPDKFNDANGFFIAPSSLQQPNTFCAQSVRSECHYRKPVARTCPVPDRQTYGTRNGRSAFKEPDNENNIC